MRQILLVLLVFIGSNLFAQNTAWAVASSSVSFKIKNGGFNVDGKFGSATATIIFDETKTTGNIIDATIDAKTINTGNGIRDGHLKKEEYFDIEKYPKILMKATALTKESNGSFKGNFKLTLKNITKDIVVPFTFSQKDGKGVFKGNFTINRLDFGVGQSSMIMADKVTITMVLNVIKK